jgi:hypothetical protein
MGWRSDRLGVGVGGESDRLRLWRRETLATTPGVMPNGSGQASHRRWFQTHVPNTFLTVMLTVASSFRTPTQAHAPIL